MWSIPRKLKSLGAADVSLPSGDLSNSAKHRVFAGSLGTLTCAALRAFLSLRRVRRPSQPPPVIDRGLSGFVLEHVVDGLGMVAFAKGIGSQSTAAVELAVAAGREARVLA